MKSLVISLFLVCLHRAKCEECYHEPNGNDYRGTVAFTIDGHVCQKWTSQSPNRHSFTPENYPSSGLGAHNYCRNPGSKQSRPWCYVVTGQGIDFCDVGEPGTCEMVYTEVIYTAPPQEETTPPPKLNLPEKSAQETSVLFNIAYEGIATQSSTEAYYPADLAVDFNKNSNFAGNSCSKTKREYEPWWKLELKHGHEIYQVVVTNRYDCCSWRIKFAEVRVGYSKNFRRNAVCGKKVLKTKWRAETIVFDCLLGSGKPLWGKYISIELIDYVKPLTLCEVEVMTKVSEDWAEISKDSSLAKIWMNNF